MLEVLTVLQTTAVLSPSGEDREGEGVHPSKQAGEEPLTSQNQDLCFCFLLCGRGVGGMLFRGLPGRSST